MLEGLKKVGQLVSGSVHELGETLGYLDTVGSADKKRARNERQVAAALRTQEESGTHDPVAEARSVSGVQRTMEMDAQRVQTELARLPDKVFRMMKQAAFANQDSRKDVTGAIKRKFYGSPHHKEYGAYVEFLTGGRITAEEAMRMNPSGGIAGPGLLGVAFDSGVFHEHAIRHDATGFLMCAFNIGPGYGGKDGSNMLNGQVEGLARELVISKSQLPSTDKVSAPIEDPLARKA